MRSCLGRWGSVGTGPGGSFLRTLCGLRDFSRTTCGLSALLTYPFGDPRRRPVDAFRSSSLSRAEGLLDGDHAAPRGDQSAGLERSRSCSVTLLTPARTQACRRYRRPCSGAAADPALLRAPPLWRTHVLPPASGLPLTFAPGIRHRTGPGCVRSEVGLDGVRGRPGVSLSAGQGALIASGAICPDPCLCLPNGHVAGTAPGPLR